MNSRKIFVELLSELARKDPTVMLIVCDVGFSYIEDFAKEFPNQFLNLGVTEQAATGIAAGMALSGMKPYLYTMVPFVLLRNAEQVRNDIVMHNANVKLVGVSGSEHYKFLGFSHNIPVANELLLIRALGIKSFIAPQGEKEFKEKLFDLMKSHTAWYIRL